MVLVATKIAMKNGSPSRFFCYFCKNNHQTTLSLCLRHALPPQYLFPPCAFASLPAIWPVYGLLTPLMLLVLFIGFIFSTNFMPYFG